MTTTRNLLVKRNKNLSQNQVRFRRQSALDFSVMLPGTHAPPLAERVLQENVTPDGCTKIISIYGKREAGSRSAVGYMPNGGLKIITRGQAMFFTQPLDGRSAPVACAHITAPGAFYTPPNHKSSVYYFGDDFVEFVDVFYIKQGTQAWVITEPGIPTVKGSPYFQVFDPRRPTR